MSLALWLLCTWAVGQTPAQAPAPEEAEVTQAPDAPEADLASTLLEWRELLEIDQAGHVLSSGPERVAAGGDLAAEGEAVALVARALFDHGHEARALALLEGAQPSAATVGFVELELARIWIASDELDRALEFLMPGPDAKSLRASDQPESWLLVGRAWTRRGEAERARPFLERFVGLAPYHPEAPAALHMLAQAAVRAGDGPRATALARRAQELGRWQSFLRVRRIQVREQPSEPLPHLGLAQLWLQAGELDRAELELARLFALAPEHPAGWFHQGEVLRKRGDLPGAARAFDRALAGDPELYLARHNRAVIALSQQRPDDARRDLEILVAGEHATDPHMLGAHLLLARVLLDAGETPAATASYERYRELGGREPLQP